MAGGGSEDNDGDIKTGWSNGANCQRYLAQEPGNHIIVKETVDGSNVVNCCDGFDFL